MKIYNKEIRQPVFQNSFANGGYMDPNQTMYDQTGRTVTSLAQSASAALPLTGMFAGGAAGAAGGAAAGAGAAGAAAGMAGALPGVGLALAAGELAGGALMKGKDAGDFAYNAGAFLSPSKRISQIAQDFGEGDYLQGGLDVITGGSYTPIRNMIFGEPASDARARRNKELDQQDKVTNKAVTDTYGQKNFAMGGMLNEFQNGGSHEQNPMGGIPQGIGANGQPNMVEEGETRQGDYIFSDRMRITPDVARANGLPKSYIGKTFAEASKEANKELEDRPNDSISKRGQESMINKLKMASESLKPQQSFDNGVNNSTFANGGNLGMIENILNSAMRVAPVVGNRMMRGDLEKPAPIHFGRMADTYTPDYINKEDIRRGAVENREALIRRSLEASGGSSAAARANILGVTSATARGMGDTILKADQANRQMDLTDAQMEQQRQGYNLGQERIEQDLTARDMGAYESRKAALDSAFWSSLGAMGKERQQSKMIGKATGYTPMGKHINPNAKEGLDLLKFLNI